jgi:hypothetical protein
MDMQQRFADVQSSFGNSMLLLRSDDAVAAATAAVMHAHYICMA